MITIPLSHLSSEVMRLATTEVERLGHAVLRVEHILLALLALRSGSAASVIDSMGLDRSRLHAELTAHLPCGKVTVKLGQYPIGSSGRLVIERAVAAARRDGTGMVTTACMLLGVVSLEQDPILSVLRDAGVDLELLGRSLEARAADPE